MSVLTAEQAFVHVADAFRWLAASVCSWERVKGGHLSSTDLQHLRRIAPNVEVALQAGCLAYSRMLIEFFRHDDRYADDIKADRHFQVRLDGNGDLAYLVNAVKPAIDAHLAHISELRDPTHPRRGQQERLDWDAEISDIADRLIRILAAVVTHDPPPACPEAWRELLNATRARRGDPCFRWPASLLPMR